MKLRNANLFLLLILLFSFGELFSQASLIPTVKIKDHVTPVPNTGVINIDCDYEFLPGRAVKLTADYPEIKQTNKYSVSSIDYKEVDNLLWTTPDIFGYDEKGDSKKQDVFGAPIDLPFEFCFYGEKFLQLVISDNGVISFGTLNSQKECPYIVSGSIPNSGLPKNSIFGVYHDMENVDKIRYAVTGTIPYRQFVIYYDHIPQYNDSRKISTSYIVLHETTNIIDIYVKDKDLLPNTLPTDPPTTIPDSRRTAVVGLTDGTGSDRSIAAINTGIWEEHNKAWRFTPDGNTSISVNWYNEFGTYIGYGNTITVYPTSDTKYKVEVNYTLCSTLPPVKDEIEVKFSPEFPTANTPSDKVFCINEGESYKDNLKAYESEINNTPGLTFTYFKDAGLTNEILDPEHYSFSSDQIVHVKVLKSGICFIVAKINLKLNKKPTGVKDQEVIICDVKNDDTETVYLLSKIVGFNTYTMGIKVFPDLISAENGIGEITIAPTYNITITGDKTVYARIYNKIFNNPECYTIAEIKLKLTKYIEFKPDVKILICYYSNGENAPNQNIEKLIKDAGLLINPTAGVTLEYYKRRWSSPITDPTNATIKVGDPIYIKATAPGYCPVEITVTTGGDPNCDGTGGGGGNGGGGGGGWGVAPTCDATAPFVVDLNQYYNAITSGIVGGTTLIGFYTSQSNADNDLNPLSNPYLIDPLGASVGKKDIYVKYKINGSSVIKVDKAVVHYSSMQLLKPDTFDICDTYNDGSEVVLLKGSKYEKIFTTMYGAGTPVYFYHTLADLYDDEDKNPKKKNKPNITIGTGSTPVYVLVEVSSGCKYVYTLHFNLTPIAFETLPKTICDFGDDGTEIHDVTKYLDKIKADTGISSPFFVGYYYTLTNAHDKSNPIPDPTKALIQTGQMSVFVRLERTDMSTFGADPGTPNHDENKTCPVIVEIKFDFTTAVALPDIEPNIYACDNDGNGREFIDLNLAVTNIIPNTDITYYTTPEGAETADTNHLITNFSNYELIVTTTPIYVRVVDNNNAGCYKVLSFNANITKLPAIVNNIASICDFQNDGKEIITDLEIGVTPQLTFSISLPDPKYEYFISKTEAEKGTSPITTFEATNANSIWVKVTPDIKAPHCYRVFEVKFKLVRSPELITPKTYFICNNNTKNDGAEISELVNLDQYREYILGFPVTPDYDFTYYDTSETDAVNGGNSGKVSSNYTITSFPKTIWVRVTNTITGCFSVTHIVIDQYESLDKDVTDDKIIFCAKGELNGEIDLTLYPPRMTANPANYDITYHYTKAEALPDNAITTVTGDLTEQFVTPSSVFWIKFKDKKTGCFIVKKLDVVIYGSPKARSVFPYICDESDGKLDGNYVVNLDSYKGNFPSQKPELNIIAGEPNLNDLYSFIYRDKNGNLIDPINADNFSFNESELSAPGTMGDPYFYQVSVRVDKKDGTGCYSEVSIMFNISPKVPIVNSQPEILECDESDNDGKTNFDLTSVKDQISTTAGVSFKYYPTETDAQNNTNEITTITAWKNINTYEHSVYVRVSAPNHCDNIASIKLIVYPYILAVDYPNVEVCEFQSDGKTKSTVNLLEEVKHMTGSINTVEYPNLLDDLIITYHTSLADAQSSSTGIQAAELSAYPVLVGVTEIWVRFQSKTTKCFEIKKMTITKIEAPKIEDVNYLLCDDNLDNVYDIDLKTLDVLVSKQIGDYTITYHETLTGAETNSGELSRAVNYIIAVSDFDKIIGVRIVDNTTGCVTTKALTFSTNPKVPIVNSQPEILECDESDNDGKTNFDLTSVKDQISTTAGVSFKYYPTETDAQNNTNEITTITAWKNINTYEHSVYVRVSAPNHCDNIASIKLIVYPYILAVDYPNVEVCEFQSDGKTKSTVNLLEEVKHMTGSINTVEYPNLLDDLIITYHTSLADAQSSSTGIQAAELSAYPVLVGVTEIWVRFQSKTTKCFEIKKMTITKIEAPKIEDVNYLLCDDNLDNVYDIDLKTLDVLVSKQIGDYTITYHETLTGAETNSGELSRAVNYIIAVSDFDKIIGVRIVDNTTGCVTTKALTFSTNPKVPIVNSQPEILECDESDNDGKTNFDLTSVKDQISTTAGVSFKYYPTETDAQNNTNEITTITAWKNINTYEHSVYVRVSAPNHCDNIASIKLIVYPYILAVDYPNVEVCEFQSDGKTKSTVNLLEEVKHMTGSINTVEYPNLLDDLIITYHTSLADAQSSSTGIQAAELSAYPVLVGVTEIWVRFQSKTTKCFEIKKMTITKIEAPKIEDVNYLLCDDNLDNVYDIDLKTLDVLVSKQIGDYTITYHETLTGAETNSGELSRAVNYIIAVSDFDKIIGVRIVDNTTGCVTTKALTFSTNPKVPIVNSQPEILECDESDNDGKTNFDLTSVKDQISTTAGVSFKYYPTETDAQNNTNEITTITAWKNINTYEHSVYVRVSAPNHCDNIASIKLIVYPYILAVDYPNVEVCEFQSDGKTKSTVNLLEEVKHMTGSINTVEYPNLLDDLIITYHTSLADAQSSSTGIQAAELSAYPVLVGVTEIWVRFQSKTTKCFEIKKMTITKIEAPKIEDVNYLLCDDNLDNVYDIDLKTLDVLVSKQIGDYTITYHETLTGAETNSGELSRAVNYIIAVSDFDKIIGVRIVDNTTGCVTTKALTFSTNPKVPIVNSQPEILECDESDNDGKTNFDLTSVKDQISTTAGVSFKYYPTETDAQNNTNEITTITAWKNINTYEHSVYVRVSAPNHCDNIASIKLIVYPYILAVDYPNVEVCEFQSDGKTKSTVNLLEEVKHMTGSINTVEYPNLLDDLIITYHTSLADAQSSSTGIQAAELSAYPVLVGVTEIWVRFQSKTTKCFEIKKMTITKIEAPKIEDVNYLLCDDNLDNVYDIDLKTLDVLVSKQIGDYTITYHETLTGAETNSGELSRAVNYIIAVSDFDKIIGVRIVDNTTGCVTTKALTFSTNPKVPLITVGITSTLCDENDLNSAGYNDGKGEFNLTVYEDQFVNLPSGKKATFTYYTNKIDAGLNKNPILNPGAYVNSIPYKQVIYVRISAEDYCDNRAQLELRVYPSIQTVDYDFGDICELVDDTGETKKLNLIDEAIPAMQQGLEQTMKNDLEVTFYQKLADAKLGPIAGSASLIGDLNHPTTALTEYLPAIGINTVYVRFESKTHGCSVVKEIKAFITAAPEMQPVSYTICDNDLDDQFYIIPKELDHSGVVVNPNEYTLSYYTSKANAWADTSPLPLHERYPIITFPAPTTIYARAVDKRGCVNVEVITVETRPRIELVNKEVELVACDGNNDGFTEFDLTLVHEDISVESNIQFIYFSTLEEAQKNRNPISNFDAYINKQANSDYVYVRVEEENSTGTRCPSLAKIKLVTYYPLQPEKVHYICPRIEDVTIDGGDFDAWEWRLDGRKVGEGRYFTTGETGLYTLTVTKNLNYGLICTATFQVEIRPLEEPVIIELKAGKDYIEVIAKGPAPLEYSIDNINWQKSNIFNRLEAGIYTIYVRSTANGCEAVTSKGIIFGVPNVITPNGDGYNDTWKVYGLDLFEGQPSQVKIFDRYGKQVFEQTSNTYFLWDGKYLGRVLPTTSYWYIITIVDGRQFTGWILLRNYDEGLR